MNTVSQPPEPARGRALLWIGLALCVLGFALCVVQFSQNILVMPWYAPILSTIGAVLLAVSLMKRTTFVRIVALILVIGFAGFEWVALTVLMKLPAYEGPAHADAPMPAFQTVLADGRPFTEKNLQDGQTSVLVFFRGRW